MHILLFSPSTTDETRSQDIPALTQRMCPTRNPVWANTTFQFLPKLDPARNNNVWFIFMITWVLCSQSEESEVSKTNLISITQNGGREMHLK